MYDAMQHPLFASLRLIPAQCAAAATTASVGYAPQHLTQQGVVRYMHYYRSPADIAGAAGVGAGAHLHQDAGVDALPIL